MSNGTRLVEREKPSSDRAPAVVVFSALLIVGTGSLGAVPPCVNGTIHYDIVRDVRDVHDVHEISMPSLRELLHDARSNFQLSAGELANVLGVSRQTLYDWSSERAEPRIDRQRRIRELANLGAEWRALIGPDIETLHRKFSDKPDVLAILADTSLTPEAKSQKMGLLAQRRRSVVGRKSVADRLTELGFAPSAQERVLDDQEW